MTTTQRQPNRAKEVTALTGLIAGAKKRLTGVTQVTLAGATITIAVLLSDLQGLLDGITAADRHGYALCCWRPSTPRRPPSALASAFTAYVRTTFGNQADTLAGLALAPRKVPPPRTLEQKQAAAAKALATRKARGTVSAKAKKAITGTVATATAPVTPASPAAPAVPAATPTATPPKA